MFEQTVVFLLEMNPDQKKEIERRIACIVALIEPKVAGGYYKYPDFGVILEAHAQMQEIESLSLLDQSDGRLLTGAIQSLDAIIREEKLYRSRRPDPFNGALKSIVSMLQEILPHNQIGLDLTIEDEGTMTMTLHGSFSRFESAMGYIHRYMSKIDSNRSWVDNWGQHPCGDENGNYELKYHDGSVVYVWRIFPCENRNV